MATKGKAPAKSAEVEAAPAKSSKKLLFIIVGVVLVLVIGGAAFFMMGGKSKKSEEHAEEKVEAKAPTFVVIEPFVVNLQQETGDHYLQVAMTLQVPNSDRRSAQTVHAAGAQPLADGVVEQESI